MLTLGPQKLQLCNSEAELVRLGQGGEGIVYRVDIGDERLALKLYRSPDNLKEQKILAMINSQPTDCEVVINNRRYIQLAWPKQVVYRDGVFAGFLMPYVDTDSSVTLDHYLDQSLLAERNTTEHFSLPLRLELARNLAAVVAHLHTQKIWFIDFKPQNIRVYDQSNLVAFIDCDGFSLSKDGRQFLANNFSSEYISPDALKKSLKPGELGEDQDLFALAVVIFQLLNYGIHPFSGVVNKERGASTTDEKVAEGLYAYGRLRHPSIDPNILSVHDCFPDTLRELFDRAFSFVPAYTAASVWVREIASILNNKELERCAVFATDASHIRFLGKGCITCLRQRQIAISQKELADDELFRSQPAPVSVSYTSGSIGFKIFIGVIGIFLVMWLANLITSTPSYVRLDQTPPVSTAPSRDTPLDQTPPVSTAPSRDTPKASPVDIGHVSLYYSPLDNKGGVVWGFKTQNEADEAAYQRCLTEGGISCKKAGGKRARCIVVSQSGDGSICYNFGEDLDGLRKSVLQCSGHSDWKVAVAECQK